MIGPAAYCSCFFVDQTQYVYVTTFGKPQRLCVEPGLEFKWPYQSLYRFDRRMQMSNPPGSQMLTRASARDTSAQSFGGHTLSIEWYACWQIPSPEFAAARGVRLESKVLRFLQSVGNMMTAEDRLRERIDAMLKAEVGNMSLAQFVNLNEERIQLEELNRQLTKRIGEVAFQEFGIQVVDVRIKRFNHPAVVRPAIFDMIRTERQGVAERYRAEGKSEAARTRSDADKLRAQILSKAYADAERIRGEGDAQAMRIANTAHSQDPQFYQLTKTFDTYRTILNEKTTVVLSADSRLLQLLTAGMPKLPEAKGQLAPAKKTHKQQRPLASDGNQDGHRP